MSARTTNEYFDTTVCVRVTAAVVVVGSVCHVYLFVLMQREKSAHTHGAYTQLRGDTSTSKNVRTQM